MIMAIYRKAFGVLMRKPLKLWGISLLYLFLSCVGVALCGIAIPIFGIAVALLLETSMTIIFLRGYRGEDVRAVNLFDCFRDWATIKRVLCGMGWMLLWIFLWSLIPIVGIIFALIRTYEYRLTPYILVMEPDVKPSEAIKLSKQRTMGWKGKMFGADILIVVFFYVAFLILLLLARIPYAGIVFAILLVLFVILFCLLAPLFIGLVQAAFYEEIRTWGSYPGRAAYAPVKPAPAPGPYAPPQGYDPQQGYPPQGYDPQQPYYAPPQGYDPQQPYYAPPQGYQPPQPQWQAPQEPQWQAPQEPQPQWQQPPQPQWQAPAPDAPQPDFPQSEAPVWPQPDFPQPPAWPEPPQEPPQE